MIRALTLRSWWDAGVWGIRQRTHAWGQALQSQVGVEDVTTSESFCLRRAQPPSPDLEHKLDFMNVHWPGGEPLRAKWLQPTSR